MKILDGKSIAQRKSLELQKVIKRKKVNLSLAVVQVGKNPVSEVYVKQKRKKLGEMGIKVSVYNYREEIKEETFQAAIASLKEDAIIVQLPLPEKLNTRKVLDAIPERKDADLLSSASCGKFYTGKTKTLPPVVGATNILLEEYEISLKGKKVVLVGSGELVGKPLSIFFLRKSATVSIVNKDTPDISIFLQDADIIVSGAGKPGLLQGEMVKEGAVLIDAGASSEKGVIKGDVNTESLKGKDCFVSPVPGGVGPLTVYCLAKNILDLQEF